jgi:hypothetical protein
MASDHRTISGRRADLNGVRGPERLLRVALEGPGIASLEGIERMANLDTLYLERLNAPELHLLETLAHLRILVIHELKGTVDYGRLGRLPALEYLSILVRADARREVSAADLSGLTRLRVLKLHLLGATARLDAPWLTDLAELERLVLEGFVLADETLALALRKVPPLRALSFTPASRSQQTAAMNSEIASVVTDLSDLGIARLGTIFEHKGDDGLTYSVGLDLAATLQLETNIEAEARLIDALRIHAPELLEELQFDTESSSIWLVCSRREALEAVLSLAADLQSGRQRA